MNKGENNAKEKREQLRVCIAYVLYEISMIFSIFADKIGRTAETENKEYHVVFFGYDSWYC